MRGSIMSLGGTGTGFSTWHAPWTRPSDARRPFDEAVRDLGRTTDWLAANPHDQVQARLAELYARAAEVLWPDGGDHSLGAGRPR